MTTRYFMTAQNTLRLLNLPRAAKIADVRKFFWNMFIPEGGVLIVGGERGETFVTFSTDEDCKRALHFDGGYIHSVRVTLMLSSYGELRKVYEYTQKKLKEFEYLTLKRMQNYQPPKPWDNKLANMNGYDGQHKRELVLNGRDGNWNRDREHHESEGRLNQSWLPIIRVAGCNGMKIGSAINSKTSDRPFLGEWSHLPANYRVQADCSGNHYNHYQPMSAFTSTPVTARTRNRQPYENISSTNGVFRHRLPPVLTQPYQVWHPRHQNTRAQ